MKEKDSRLESSSIWFHQREVDSRKDSDSSLIYSRLPSLPNPQPKKEKKKERVERKTRWECSSQLSPTRNRTPRANKPYKVLYKRKEKSSLLFKALHYQAKILFLSISSSLLPWSHFFLSLYPPKIGDEATIETQHMPWTSFPSLFPFFVRPFIPPLAPGLAKKTCQR